MRSLILTMLFTVLCFGVSQANIDRSIVADTARSIVSSIAKVADSLPRTWQAFITSDADTVTTSDGDTFQVRE